MKRNAQKILAFVVSVMIVFTGISFPVNAEGAKAASKVVRDVVLVLDASGSMRGQPNTAMKGAATKFCEQLMQASGETNVAIVVYSSQVDSTLDFTNDLTSIDSFVSKIPALGGTNIYSALERAKELLDERDSANIKNIVLLTDGLPENGQRLNTGKYDSYSSIYSRPYANAIYNYFVNELDSHYNVYTLGFFHTLRGSNLNFGEAFLNDVQNGGFYEVKNPDDLIFTFGELADDINDDYKAEDTCPIIIVPGVMGSQLYDTDMKLVWADIGRIANPFYRLSNHMDMSKTMLVKNYDSEGPINQEQLGSGSREYGTQDTYKELVNGVIDRFTDETGTCQRAVYFFSYDFRQKNSLSADQLEIYINDILAENPGYTKVDLVAHSMGGLVVSDYVKDCGNENIRKVITCGTPYEGSPKLVSSVLTADVLDGFWLNAALLVCGGLNKSTKASFPALAELSPTKRYFDQHSSDFKQYAGLKCEWFLKFSRVYNNIEYNGWLSKNRTIFGSGNANSAISFHESLIREGMNLLATLDNSYFIVGVNQKTIKGIYFNSFDSFTFMSVKDLTYEYSGDGTVPYDSSTMMQSLRYLPSNRYFEYSTDHSGAAGCGGKGSADKALNTILALLSDSEPSLSSDPRVKKGYIVIRIACPVDVTIDHNGQTLCSDFDEFSCDTDYGCLDIIGDTEETIKMLCLDEDNYTVELQGTGEGTMDYSIRYFNEDEQLDVEFDFEDVMITPSTKITTTTEKDNIVLLVDEDGDGVVDYTLEPGNCEGNGRIEEDENGNVTFTSERYDVNYEIMSEYDDKYLANVTITNKSEETLHNWELAMDAPGEMNFIWNGIFTVEDGYSIVRNAEYNQDIAPGQSVSFGFEADKVYTDSENQNFVKPKFMRLIENKGEADNQQFTADFEVTDDWESGYNAKITVTNISDQAMNDWTLAFDFADNIESVVNGEIIVHEGDHYIISNAMYDQNIAPGASIELLFTISNRQTDSVPKDFVLTTVN